MSQMSQTTEELKKEIQKTLGLMRSLRDEVRVQVHLAGLEVKDEWQRLEPQLHDVERAASDFSEATRTALSETVSRLSKLKSALGVDPKKPK